MIKAGGWDHLTCWREAWDDIHGQTINAIFRLVVSFDTPLRCLHLINISYYYKVKHKHLVHYSAARSVQQ
jgi:hypothetical protein